MKKNITKKESGYTIIETMIAVSLFVIIVTIGMGALLNANLLHQKSQSMRSIIDNLSFVMEDMSRNLRTGYNYQCFDSVHTTLSPATLGSPRSCTNGWAIAFEYQNGETSTYSDQWVYYISSDGKIFKSTNGANNFVQLTPDEIVIDTALSGFKVIGAEPPSYNGDTQQPFVTIKLVGKITFKNVETPFSLQTSVSQRVIDIN
jgi:Tfp pilus assembly protein PilW